MFMNSFRLYLLLTLMVFINKSHAQTIIKASDIWCPFICESINQKGVIIDVVNAIAKDKNLDVKFELIPLSRSLRMAKNKQVDIVLALTSSHISEYKLQRSQLSFGGLYNDFYVHEKSNWRYDNVKSLIDALKQGRLLGLINGYDYGKDINNVLKSYPSSTYFTSGNTPLENNLKMLNNQRLDIVLDSRFNVDFETNNHQLEHIVYAGTEGKFTPLYLGFRQDINSKLIIEFDEGLKKLRENGTLAEILNRYQISDWL